MTATAHTTQDPDHIAQCPFCFFRSGQHLAASDVELLEPAPMTIDRALAAAEREFASREQIRESEPRFTDLHATSSYCNDCPLPVARELLPTRSLTPREQKPVLVRVCTAGLHVQESLFLPDDYVIVCDDAHASARYAIPARHLGWNGTRLSDSERPGSAVRAVDPYTNQRRPLTDAVIDEIFRKVRLK